MATPGADAGTTTPAGAPAGTPAATTTTTPFHGTEPWVHSACLAVAVLGPIGLLLPPRRVFGVRSLLLVSGTAIATNQLAYDFSGQTIAGRMSARAASMSAVGGLPEPARQRQAAMRAERERRAAVAAQAQAQAEAAAAAPAAPAAPAPTDWVAERQRKEKEVLEAGGSYWDLIVGQITEVWTDLRGKGK